MTAKIKTTVLKTKKVSLNTAEKVNDTIKSFTWMTIQAAQREKCKSRNKVSLENNFGWTPSRRSTLESVPLKTHAPVSEREIGGPYVLHVRLLVDEGHKIDGEVSDNAPGTCCRCDLHGLDDESFWLDRKLKKRQQNQQQWKRTQRYLAWV